jgi:hypothetical protein
MNLTELITDRKSAILGRWFDLAIASYPAVSASFLKSKKNRFANPVGFILPQELTPILDGLLKGVEIQTLKPFLDNIIRIRAVQDFEPSRALNFVFSLKETIRQELEKEIRENRLEQQLLSLESRIDTLSLLAFDLFMHCREKIYDLKANEMKNRTVRLLKRAKLVEEDPPESLRGSDN